MENKTIEFWCKKFNFTQKELSKKLEISEQTIVNWKKSGFVPTKYVAMLEQLAHENQYEIPNENESVAKQTAIEYGSNEMFNRMFSQLIEQNKTIIEQSKTIEQQLHDKDKYIQFCMERITDLIGRQYDRQRVESDFIRLFERLQSLLNEMEAKK